MTDRAVRKCAFTNRRIATNDNASVVYTLGLLDESGRYTGENKIFSVSGTVRKAGTADRMLYSQSQEQEY